MQLAVKSLPSSYMLSDIPAWFRKSSIRREACKRLFDVMNGTEEMVGIPLPFLKM